MYDDATPQEVRHDPSLWYWIRAGFGIGIGLLIWAIIFTALISAVPLIVAMAFRA